jgi:cysteine-rich repeat protein
MKRRLILALLVPVLALPACGSSVKATRDADQDAPGDSAGDMAADVTSDAPEDGTGDPTEETTIPPDCGDGDVDAGEECDDGNTTDGDGCDNDCTWSCEEASECDDADACTDDACDVLTHTCTHEATTCDDSDECTVDDCEPSTGCTHTPLPEWWVDGDDDGFGSPLADSVCAETAPEGYVDNDDDCCDAYPVVRPDQTAWFVEPYSCPGGPTTHPTHDYNCDGVEERRYMTAGSCSMSGGGCVATEGWIGDSIPRCGHAGDWLSSCGFDSSTGTCAPNGAREQIQTCR